MKNTVKARAVSRAVSGGRDRVRANSVSRSGAPGTPSRRARQARRKSSTARNVSSPASRPTTRPSVAASQRTSWRSGASWGRATGGGSGTVGATWEVVMAVLVSHDRGDRGTAQGDGGARPGRRSCAVRIRNGKMSTTDGPFAETKEQLGGFYLINARDLNDAIQVASKIPSARLGSVEVRPIMVFNQQ